MEPPGGWSFLLLQKRLEAGLAAQGRELGVPARPGDGEGPPRRGRPLEARERLLRLAELGIGRGGVVAREGVVGAQTQPLLEGGSRGLAGGPRRSPGRDDGSTSLCWYPRMSP